MSTPVERLDKAMQVMYQPLRAELAAEFEAKAAEFEYRYKPEDGEAQWYRALADILRAGPGFTCDDPRLGGGSE